MDEQVSEFNDGQTVMASRQGQRISQTAALVERCWFAVVSIYQRWNRGEPLGAKPVCSDPTDELL